MMDPRDLLESPPEGPQHSKERKMGSPRPRWTGAQIETLEELRKKGMSARQIAASGLLPQSLNAIQKKLGRMDLVSHVKIVKFNARQRDEFRDFLRRNWEGRTPQDLLDMWNESNPSLKVVKNKVIHYLTQLGLKICYGEVQSINKARRREERIRNSAKSPTELAELLKASRAIVMTRRIGLGRDIWTGMPLNEEDMAGSLEN